MKRQICTARYAGEDIQADFTMVYELDRSDIVGVPDQWVAMPETLELVALAVNGRDVGFSRMPADLMGPIMALADELEFQPD